MYRYVILEWMKKIIVVALGMVLFGFGADEVKAASNLDCDQVFRQAEGLPDSDKQSYSVEKKEVGKTPLDYCLLRLITTEKGLEGAYENTLKITYVSEDRLASQIKELKKQEGGGSQIKTENGLDYSSYSTNVARNVVVTGNCIIEETFIDRELPSSAAYMAEFAGGIGPITLNMMTSKDMNDFCSEKNGKSAVGKAEKLKGGGLIEEIDCLQVALRIDPVNWQQGSDNKIVVEKENLLKKDGDYCQLSRFFFENGLEKGAMDEDRLRIDYFSDPEKNLPAEAEGKSIKNLGNCVVTYTTVRRSGGDNNEAEFRDSWLNKILQDNVLKGLCSGGGGSLLGSIVAFISNFFSSFLRAFGLSK